MLRKIAGKSQVTMTRLGLAAIAAILLVLSFPSFNLNLLAWVALVPLFFAVDGLKPSKAFLVAYLTGAIFFLGTIYWLVHVTLPGMAVVVLYLALYFGLFGLVYSQLKTHNSQLILVLLPAVWVTAEWLRAHLLTGFGWALLGHSQAANPVIIQIADITGAYGVGFLIVLVNAAIFLTIRDAMRKDYKIGYLIIALTLVFIVTAYGSYRLRNIFSGERIKVAVVQGNIPQTRKWDLRFREEILSKYEALTRQAAGSGPDLIIWPETSVPAFLEFEKDVSDRISGLSKTLQIPILAGAPSTDSGDDQRLYNSAVLFGADGKFAGKYDKLHLVPFGEYVPFKRALGFVERFAPSPIGDFSGGKDFSVFSFFLERRSSDEKLSRRLLKKVKFSCLVCFEDIFPDISREFVKRGAGFLVNITNDAWFKDSSAAYQHAQCSIFRAVENRVNVVRAANTGLSCIIDQKGQVVAEVSKGGRDLFVEGSVSHDIVLTRARAPYTVYGDVFAYACIAFATLFIIIFRKDDEARP